MFQGASRRSSSRSSSHGLATVRESGEIVKEAEDELSFGNVNDFDDDDAFPVDDDFGDPNGKTVKVNPSAFSTITKAINPLSGRDCPLVIESARRMFRWQRAQQLCKQPKQQNHRSNCCQIVIFGINHVCEAGKKQGICTMRHVRDNTSGNSIIAPLNERHLLRKNIIIYMFC